MRIPQLDTLAVPARWLKAPIRTDSKIPARPGSPFTYCYRFAWTGRRMDLALGSTARNRHRILELAAGIRHFQKSGGEDCYYLD